MAERYCDVIYGHDDAVRSVSFSPDGTMLVSGDGTGKVRFWNMKKRRCVEELDEFKSSVACVSFSPDGKHWAAMDREGSIRIHSRDGSQSNFKGTASAKFRWTADSRHIVTSNIAARVVLWSLETKQSLLLQKHEGSEVMSLAVSPDGHYVASGDKNARLCIWDLWEGKELPGLEYHKAGVWALAFSPDSQTLGSADQRAFICYWDMEKKAPRILPFQWSTHEINDIAFCPKEHNLFATCGQDNRIKLLDIDNGNRRLEEFAAHNRGVNSICFSPDGQYLASGGGDHRIIVWKIKKPSHVS